MIAPIFVLALALTPEGGSEVVCPPGFVCVADADMKDIVQVLSERECLDTTQPTFTLDPVVIYTDEQGRVYYSGAEPEPYKVGLTWCHYSAQATGKVLVSVAKAEKPVWGFRFRPKAYVGYLLLDQMYNPEESFSNGLDVGVALDFLFYKNLNADAFVGYRSLGVGVGLDVTENFGVYLNYSHTWQGIVGMEVPYNIGVGIDFAF